MSPRADLAGKLISLALLAFPSFVLDACARPGAPTTAAPSSANAPEGATAELTRALAEDPPLPGAPTDGWIGLTNPAAAEDPHAHHHHGGGHGH